MSAKTIISNAYMAIILAILVWGPLFALHGYRQWWALVFYGGIAFATIGGITSHYRTLGRSTES